ncbi:MAG TPA: hypothetical protein VFC44_09610 [Candidatus Saccharimonadales bacterium]|nr:hypothetical protein [Candidatus Saccharimonadales bacterium]
MKTKIAALFLASLLTGCVATSYQKSISVTKDPQENIISTTETESVSQPPNSGSASAPIKFKYLKDWGKD